MRAVVVLSLVLVSSCSGRAGSVSEQEAQRETPRPETTDESTEKAEKAKVTPPKSRTPAPPEPAFPPDPKLKPPPDPDEYEDVPPDPECDCQWDDCYVGEDGDCTLPCSDPAKVMTVVRRAEDPEDSDFHVSEVDCTKPPDTSCEQLPACAIAGLCTGGGDRCYMGDDACDLTLGCEWYGACEERPDGCVAGFDDDCAKSRMCRRRGECVTDGTTCVRPEELAPCPPTKVRIDGYCLHPADYDCARECEEEGRCDPLLARLDRNTRRLSRPHVVCVKSDDQCENRASCMREGDCSPHGEGTWSFNKCNAWNHQICAVTGWGGCTISRCADSLECRLYGRCGYGRSMNCVPTKPEHCRESLACKRSGSCGMVQISGGHTCEPTKPEHCEQSSGCTDDGRCVLEGGTCVDPGEKD